MRYVVGIDEVGRGPLAGPVVLAAALLPLGWRPKKGKGRVSLKDSKQLTAIQRERWAEHLSVHPKVRYAIAKAFPRTIEEMNIARAANAAALRAFLGLCREACIDPADCIVYLDGGLYLGNRPGPRKRALVQMEEVCVDVRTGARVITNTVIKGDELIPAVRIASIFAKVHRDELMRREAKKYPGYGFERHKGYATKAHYAALRELGPSLIHRSTFLHLTNPALSAGQEREILNS